MNILKQTKGLIVGLLLLTGVITPALVSSPTYAQVPEGAKNAACEGLGAASGQSCDASAGASIRGLLRTVINLLSWVVGVVAVIMVILGGLKYITSNGDSNSITSAKNTVMYALIGLAVAALAQVLVRTVLSQVSPDSAARERQIQACRDALPSSEWGDC